MIPKITIIVPNYNHEEFLPKRLESIFNQTFKDFEVILLDDASTDNSLSILKEYSVHPKVTHLLLNEKNSGNAFLQWTKGISKAQGEFIWIAESDDYCENNFLEILISKIQLSTVLIYSASQIVNTNDEILGIDQWAKRMDSQKWSSDYHNEGINEIKDYLRYRNTIPNASAVLFRRNTINNVDFPTNMFFCGDWYVWLQIVGQGGITYVDKALNYFRKHSSSTRAFKNSENEKRRFGEYFFLIRNTSSLKEQFKNSRKFDWILNELKEKEKYLGKGFFLSLNMPIPLLLRYLKIR